jgi:hypothetical protein
VVHAAKNADGRHELGIALLEPDAAAREVIKKFIEAFNAHRGSLE